MPSVVFPDALVLAGVGSTVARRLTDGDWQLDLQLSKDPDVVRWTMTPADLTQEQAQTRITRRLDAMARGDLGYWVIEDAGRAVGTVGAGVRDDDVEIFYALLPAARGKGLAGAAVAALVTTLRAQGASVRLATFPDNQASQDVARRAGFRLSGTQTRVVKGVERLLLDWTLPR